MSSFLSRSACLALIAAGVVTAPARAQADTSLVPMSLVGALLGSTGPRAQLAHVTVGAAPAEFPAALLPPSLPVVGGALQYGRPMVLLRDSAMQGLALYQKHLDAAGFIRPASAESGFQESGSGNETWCRDSMRVVPMVVRGGAVPMLRVTYWARDARMSSRFEPPCSATPPAPADSGVLTIPVLRPPPGAQQYQSGGGSGGDGVDARATLTDPARSAAELGRYYAGLLASSGWGVTPPVANDRVSAAALDARDSKGRAWSGALLVQTQGTRHTVTVSMKPAGAR